MANYGKIYDSTWCGVSVCDNTINWGKIYKALVDCTPTPLFEILTEDGNYLITEGTTVEYLVTE